MMSVIVWRKACQFVNVFVTLIVQMSSVPVILRVIQNDWLSFVPVTVRVTVCTNVLWLCYTRSDSDCLAVLCLCYCQSDLVS